MGGFTRTGERQPVVVDVGSCRSIAGSPKKIQVQRTSLSDRVESATDGCRGRGV